MGDMPERAWLGVEQVSDAIEMQTWCESNAANAEMKLHCKEYVRLDVAQKWVGSALDTSAEDEVKRIEAERQLQAERTRNAALANALAPFAELKDAFTPGQLADFWHTLPEETEAAAQAIEANRESEKDSADG